MQIEMELDVPIDESKADPNPMVQVYGFGPDDKRCKHCSHLIVCRNLLYYFIKNTTSQGGMLV
ncbi:hypothetical protein [Metabacillus fastidiosus]|uniref:hypothetical protein n=1 Tax=Metabacillus fastidiosus TaxID=1458 RepID=UPI003D29C400